MADTHLYWPKADNEAKKDQVAELGAKIQFDRDQGAYKLITEGLKPAEVKKLQASLKEFTSPEAKAAWEQDRADRQSGKDALRAAAKQRETTTQEEKPVSRDNAIRVYPAHSQKNEFRRLVAETQSNSRYISSVKGDEHYSLVTAVPDRFAAYIGEEAKARFEREYAERNADKSKNPDVEDAREAARARGGKAFMAQYQERGFRLSDPVMSPDAHAKQLTEMRAATDKQLIRVIGVSRELLLPLREKELALRAEAAGVSVEQLRAMSFDNQKKLSEKDGKPVGLVGDDFKMNSQLSKGIAAINKELEARGVGRIREEARERSPEQEQAPQQARAPRAQGKGPQHSVSEDQSVDDTLATLQAASKRRGLDR